MKKNPIVLDVEKDQVTIENFQLELEAAVEKMKEFREILEAVVGDNSSGISSHVRKSISNDMKADMGPISLDKHI